MNYYLIILLIILFACALLETGFPKQEKLGKQIYFIAFSFTVIWIGIKYYLGPDIYSYVPFYEQISSPLSIIQGHYAGQFEIGFALFCSVLKALGVSFWGMTFVITVVYFCSIYKLFKLIPQQRTLALFSLCLLDYNLCLYEYRQCLSVSFFIFTYLALKDKRYVLAVIFSILSILMHKSAVFIYLAVMLLVPFWRMRINKRVYVLCCFILVTLFFIPLKPYLLAIIKLLPISQGTYNSIELHLAWGNSVQLIFPIYLLAIINIAYYSKFDKKEQKWHWLMWCCIVVIVFLYQYWFLLNRLRSYFLPFLLVYVFKALIFTDKRDRWLKQSFVFVFFVYGLYFMYGTYQTGKSIESKTNNVSTIFDRIQYNEEQIKARQMREAEIYWKHDFQKLGH